MNIALGIGLLLVFLLGDLLHLWGERRKARKKPLVCCNPCAQKLGQIVKEAGGKMEIRKSKAAKDSLERSAYSRKVLEDMEK